MQPNILGPIDHAHTTATQFLKNAVVRDALADHGARAGSQLPSGRAQGWLRVALSVAIDRYNPSWNRGPKGPGHWSGPYCMGGLVPRRISQDRVLPHTQALADRCVVAAPSQ